MIYCGVKLLVNFIVFLAKPHQRKRNCNEKLHIVLKQQ